MTSVEELSNRILDEGMYIANSDETFDDNSSVSFDHYGVLGMKWGIRKDREKKPYEPKKKDRRYDGESDQDYQNRMAREERERSSKQSERSKVRSEKRAAKERAQTQKRMLKSQERIKQMEIKAQQKQKETDTAERIRQEKRADKLAKEAEAKRRKEERKAEREKTKSKPVNARTLTDRELNDAIQRLRNEQTYKQLAVENKPFFKRNASKAITIGGGILLTVGTAVATQQLKKIGNEKAEDWLIKKKIIKPSDKSSKGFSQDEVDILKAIIDNVKKNAN